MPSWSSISTDPYRHRPELDLTVEADGVPSDGVVNFDNLHTLDRASFRRRVTGLSPARMARACRVLGDATGG
ncbi:MAG: type II toxin-antitoxin system PemK/MazF family toxin [Acidimicrobiia bacterium]|nr:type II toxin-antitoxin system PemK/MazF family toxin [Acidimicrobiia bacterium]